MVARVPRLALLGLASVLASAGPAQAWEKMLAPGLAYRMEVDLRTPRVLHALRWSMGAPSIFARSEVAQGRIYAAPGVEARETVSKMVERTGAIAGINGDFFPASGEPLGAMVRDGQILSRPFTGRAAFGWGLKDVAMGNLEWSGNVAVDGLEPLPLQGLNEDLQNERLTLFTEAAAEARGADPVTYLLIRMDTVGFPPTGAARGQVMEVIRNRPSVPITPGFAVLAAQGNLAARLNPVGVGAFVRMSMTTSGLDWSKIDNVMGGGPMLLRAGQVEINAAAGAFSALFAQNRHPRTAVGRTAAGDLWFVVVDGRQAMSAGATLSEMAQIMASLGCVDAVNLDGGGSSTLAIGPSVLNRPSDGSERRVGNAILFFGSRPAGGSAPIAIQGPSSILASGTQGYQLIGPDGLQVPDREVLWGAQGPGAWIDQGGTLRGLIAGPVRLTAAARGSVTSLQVTVLAAPPPTAPTGSDPPTR